MTQRCLEVGANCSLFPLRNLDTMQKCETEQLTPEANNTPGYTALRTGCASRWLHKITIKERAISALSFGSTPSTP